MIFFRFLFLPSKKYFVTFHAIHICLCWYVFACVLIYAPNCGDGCDSWFFPFYICALTLMHCICSRTSTDLAVHIIYPSHLCLIANCLWTCVGLCWVFFPWASCAIHFVPCTNGINFTAWFEGPKTALLNSAGRRHDWCRAHAMTCNVFFAMSTDEAIQSIKLRTGLAELCPCAIEPFPYLKMKTSTGLNKCAE